MLLMIDNYDSFTYNLVQYFGELGQEVKVIRNDAITAPEIAALKPDERSAFRLRRDKNVVETQVKIGKRPAMRAEQE